MLALVGPTASGKSRLAVEVSLRLGAEIVSIDSTAVYAGMDIGTDKPSRSDRRAVPHHMVDMFPADRTVTVAEFRDVARAAIDGIQSRRRIPLLVGGSGLHFRAVVDPLEFPGTDREVRRKLVAQAQAMGARALFDRLAAVDPEAAARMDPANLRRTVRALEVLEVTGRTFSSFRSSWDSFDSIYDLRVAGLTLARPELDRRINERVESQLQRGLLGEVKSLRAAGIERSLTSVQALGYAQLLAHLDGEISLEDAVTEIKSRTRRFARRQLTWFRADPRIRWFEDDPEGASGYLEGE